MTRAELGFNPSTHEVEAGGIFECLSQAWSTRASSRTASAVTQRNPVSQKINKKKKKKMKKKKKKDGQGSSSSSSVVMHKACNATQSPGVNS